MLEGHLGPLDFRASPGHSRVPLEPLVGPAKALLDPPEALLGTLYTLFVHLESILDQ